MRFVSVISLIGVVFALIAFLIEVRLGHPRLAQFDLACAFFNFAFFLKNYDNPEA